jgi:PTS system nitrogen regulatory IIA component
VFNVTRQGAAATMKLSKSILPESIKISLDSRDKEGIIRELVQRLPSARDPATAEVILGAVLESEKMATTGIGEGVAIPHAVVRFRLGLEAAFGLSEAGLDFNALDRRPVRIFFLVVSDKKNYVLQMKFLASIARLMYNQALKEELLRCRSSEEVLAVFQEEERLRAS